MTPADANSEQVFDAVERSLLAYDEQLSRDSRRGDDNTVSLASAAEQQQFAQLRDCVDQLEIARRVRVARRDVRDAETRADANDQTPHTRRCDRIARFEIRRELGRGGCGIVFLAHDPKLERLVALKVPRPEALVSEEMRRRFLREAQVAARLEHPNLVTVHEVGDDGTVCYIASTYCDGPTLAQWLADREGAVAPRQAAELVAELSDAVAYAHAGGVLHRDIKPSNVLLVGRHETNGNHRTSGLGLLPKLSDFGLAKLLEADGDVTRTGALVGTPAYMSPEQAQGQVSEIGPQTDVYALGALLYELLVGRPPFRGAGEADTLRQIVSDEPRSPRRVRRDVPRDLEAICLRCLEKRPTSRYLSARDLGDDLRRFLRGEPTTARPVAAWQRAAKWARRWPAMAALTTVTVLLFVGLAVGGWWSSVRLRRALETSEQHRQRAEASEAETQRRLYASDVKLAFQAWQADDAVRMREYLARQLPQPGEQDQRGFSWHLLWALCHTEQAVLGGHEGDVYAVDFAPDGKMFATAGKDGAIRVWDATSLATCSVLTEHDGEINFLAFSPDGRWLASCGDDATVRLWDVQRDFAPTATLSHPQSALNLTFSPDSSRLATGGRDGIIRMWDVGAAALTYELKGHTDYVQSLSFAPDAKLLASGGNDGTIRLWNLEERHQQTNLDLEIWRVTAVAFSNDGQSLASGDSGGQLRVWAVGSEEEPVMLSDNAGCVNAIAWSADNSHLVSASDDGIVRVWNVQAESCAKLIGHEGRVWSVALSPGDMQLVTTGADATARVFGASALGLERVTSAHFGGAHDVVFSPDGRLLAHAGADCCISLVDSGTLQTLAQLGGHRDIVYAIDFSSDSRWLASASNDQTIVVWDVATRSRIRQLQLHTDAVVNIDFSPDGRYLASVGNDHRLVVWNSHSWTPSHEQELLVGTGGVRFSPDARWLVAADGSRLRRWHVGTWRELASFDKHTQQINGLAFSDDGKLLATASTDRTARIWDFDRGACLATLPARSEPVMKVCFSPDTKELALCARRGGASVFDMQTHQELLSFTGHDFMSVAYSPDGQCLAASQLSFTDSSILWSTRLRTTVVPRPPVVGAQVPMLLAASSSSDAKVPTPDAASADTALPAWRALRLQPSSARVAAFTPDDRLLVTCSARGRLYLWDVASGRMVSNRTAEGDLRDHVDAVSVSPDGETIVTGAKGGVCLWDLRTGKLRYQLSELVRARHGGWSSTPCTPDGRFVLAANPDGNSYMWSLADGQQVATWPGRLLAMSRDGELMATVEEDSDDVELRSVHSREVLRRFQGHSSRVHRGAFSTDGSLLATLSEDSCALRVWDVAEGREIYCLRDEDEVDVPGALAFSPTADLLATGNTKGVIHLRVPSTGKLIAEFDLHTGRVYEVVFSHNGQLLASAGISDQGRGEVFLWSVDAMLAGISSSD
ncbi:MAG: WD40 repeat domain-containing serine/threonine-protein kinase [Pirellulales bacterium]